MFEGRYRVQRFRPKAIESFPSLRVKLLFTLKDRKLSIALSLKHDICFRMLYCGFLGRDTSRAIAVNKIQEYFERNVFVVFYLLFASTDFNELHFGDNVYLLQDFG